MSASCARYSCLALATLLPVMRSPCLATPSHTRLSRSTMGTSAPPSQDLLSSPSLASSSGSSQEICSYSCFVAHSLGVFSVMLKC